MAVAARAATYTTRPWHMQGWCSRAHRMRASRRGAVPDRIGSAAPGIRWACQWGTCSSPSDCKRWARWRCCPDTPAALLPGWLHWLPLLPRCPGSSGCPAALAALAAQAALLPGCPAALAVAVRHTRVLLYSAAPDCHLHRESAVSSQGAQNTRRARRRHSCRGRPTAEPLADPSAWDAVGVVWWG